MQHTYTTSLILRTITRYLEARQAVNGHTGPSSLAKLRQVRDVTQVALAHLIGEEGVDRLASASDIIDDQFEGIQTEADTQQ